MRAWKVINRERQQLADLEFARTAGEAVDEYIQQWRHEPYWRVEVERAEWADDEEGNHIPWYRLWAHGCRVWCDECGDEIDPDEIGTYEECDDDSEPILTKEISLCPICSQNYRRTQLKEITRKHEIGTRTHR
jgi:hypothetical protein